jgi:cardiolipin synthase (CMP-forming)
MKPQHIPNFLTIIRFLLVPPILFSILNQRFLLAFFLFVLASLTDAFDGLLARVYNWTSYFGAIVDPLADKLLLTTSFITLGWVGLVPEWLVLLIVARDLWIISGALVYRYVVGKIHFSPTLLSKINTCLQIALTIMLLVDASFLHISIWLIHTVMLAMLTTTSLTLVHYTISWTILGMKNLQQKTQLSEENNSIRGNV